MGRHGRCHRSCTAAPGGGEAVSGRRRRQRRRAVLAAPSSAPEALRCPYSSCPHSRAGGSESLPFSFDGGCARAIWGWPAIGETRAGPAAAASKAS